ncbi:MAG: hypothetical protein UU47_C0024G0004 [candidate division TM6 bacterium GW2011_GWE2_41_16]|nr:MAG: hypothetical protein UU47_C0024G0004 [candidate division TM6 bacterium GW2011_GWE2_41_16]
MCLIRALPLTRKGPALDLIKYMGPFEIAIVMSKRGDDKTAFTVLSSPHTSSYAFADILSVG